MNNKGQVRVIEVIGIIAILMLLAAAADNLQSTWKMRKYGEMGYIATVRHIDKLGIEREFKVRRWLEQDKNYVRFQAQNGDVITLRDQEFSID